MLDGVDLKNGNLAFEEAGDVLNTEPCCRSSAFYKTPPLSTGLGSIRSS